MGSRAVSDLATSGNLIGIYSTGETCLLPSCFTSSLIGVMIRCIGIVLGASICDRPFGPGLDLEEDGSPFSKAVQIARQECFYEDIDADIPGRPVGLRSGDCLRWLPSSIKRDLPPSDGEFAYLLSPSFFNSRTIFWNVGRLLGSFVKNFSISSIRPFGKAVEVIGGRLSSSASVQSIIGCWSAPRKETYLRPSACTCHHPRFPTVVARARRFRRRR